MTGAELHDTELRNVIMRGVDLSGVNLWFLGGPGLDLSEANLSDANLEHFSFRDVKIDGICYSEKTKWPNSGQPPRSVTYSMTHPSGRVPSVFDPTNGSVSQWIDWRVIPSRSAVTMKPPSAS
jgi:hypothetical protein